MKKYKKIQKGREDNSHKTVRTASLLILTVVFALILCGAASAGTPLAENQTGTVSGDLYVNTTDGWPSSTQGATNEVTQANTLPAYTSIDSAMVYVNVYSGSGTSNWPVRTTVKLDGNGDGDYDDAGELLGVEDMNIPGTTDGTVYWLNDHCNRVYSDYQVWYDVTGLITSNNPTLYVKTETLGGDGYDGRIKLLALTVAYNDGDTDQVHYWVLNGQDWINASTSPSTSTFNTHTINGQASSATLNTVALSGTDGTYTLNTSSLTGNLTETGSYYKEHQWDVTGNITPGADTNLTYANVGSSFKMNLATLTIREVATTPPEANFTTDTTGGASPLTVNFTNTSTGTITSYAWDFNNDGTTDSTDQNPSWIYNNRGTYTVKLTVTGLGGTDTETKTDIINVTGAKTWIVAADGTGDFTTLQDALNVAINGDTIYLKAGAYALTGETDTHISQSNLTIKGESADKVTLSKPGYNLYFDGSGCCIENITFMSDLQNIAIQGSNCIFRNNIVKSWSNGLSMSGTNNLIYNNKFLNQKNRALSGGYNNQIRDNLIIGTSTSYGIYMGGSSNVIENNTIQNCEYGLGILGSGTTNNTIRNNSILNNSIAGIFLYKHGSGNKVYLNTFSGTTVYVTSGTSANVAWVSPSAINYTYNGMQYSAVLGNYWGSSYAGLDDDHNGIGDTAYTVPCSMGTDSAPLMYPFSGYSIPVADFSATPLSGAAPLTVTFTDNTPGYITSWAWDFNNDGVTDSTDQNPTWTYSTAGTYTVKLTINNPAGTDDEIKTDYIVIHEPDTQAPTVAANPTSGTYNTAQSVSLTATDDQDISPDIYFTLDGTDPTTSSALYSGPIGVGSSAVLKFFAVDDVGNASAVQSENYIIDLIPIAQFVGTPTSGSTPLQVAFTNTSLNTNTYQWDFDNNGTIDSTDTNPTWTYNTAGTYTVKLTVTGPLGSDEEVKTDYITANLTITNPRTGQTYTNIQGAVADALNGDTLTLQNGTYTENITINKQLTLNSAGAVTIQAANVDLPVFNVEIAGSGSTITGFTITGATNSSGINLDFADNCNINNNVISGNLVGVKFFNSNNNNLSGNTIQNNTWAGICLDLSTGNTINNGNEVTGNQEGIFLANSSTGNIITGNNIHNNTGTGVNILSNSNSNTITGNTMSGNGVMGLLVQNSNTNTISGNTVQNNGWAGIVLDQATGNTINNSNEVSGSHEGIFLANNSNNNIISGNNIHNNTGVGISVLNSNSNQILSNTASSNGMMGIFIQNSNTNTLSGNTVQNNGWTGICLDNATSNTINNLNLVTGNQEGIFLANNSSTNIIENNQVNSNTGNGICILNSNSNTINTNQVNNNGISGIFIQNSTSTVIYHNTLESNWGGVVLDTTTSTIVHQNNFINNAEQALAANGTGNKFYQGTTGNYYNDWTTTQRRIIDGNENTYDHYPKTTPF